MNNGRSRRSSALLVLSATSLWGTSGPAEALAHAGAPAASLGAARLLLGGAVLAVIARASRGSFGIRACRSHWRSLVIAAVATGVFQAAFFAAVNRTGAGLATLVTLGAAPVSTGLLARWSQREPLSLAWGLGTLSAVAGLALLLAPGGHATVDAAGVGLALIAACCYGAYTVAAKHLLSGEGPIEGPVAGTLIGGGLVLAPALVLAPSWLGTARGAALIGWLGLVCTALAYALFVSGLRGVSAMTAGTLSLAEPLVAVLIAVLVLGERLTPLALCGGALLLAGIALAALPSPRPAPRVELMDAPG